MTAGFQVIGDHGSVQIDEKFVNIVYWGAGTVVVPPNPGPTYNSEVTVDLSVVTGNLPIVAFDTVGESIIVNSAYVGTSSGGTNSTFRYTISQANPSVAVNKTVSWYLFSQAPDPGSTGEGLVIYTATGQVTFCSLYDPMRIVNVATIPNGTPISSPAVSATSISVSGTYVGQKLAALISTPKSYMTEVASFPNYNKTFYSQNIITGNNDNSGLIPYVKTDAYGVTGTVTESFSTPSGNREQPQGGSLMAIDVSNVYIRPYLTSTYPDAVKPPGSL